MIIHSARMKNTQM